MKRVLLVLLVLAMVLSAALAGCAKEEPSETTAAPAETTEGEEPAETTEGEAPSMDEIKIGHLSYHTGPFGHAGPMFDAGTNFPLTFVNENPPLGAKVTAIHQDIGTIGEGQAARKLIESDGVHVLLNVAGEYMSYRDWILGYIEENNAPLMPSVHGGSIDIAYGGVAEEPIFRGAPMDSDQGLAAALMASKEGAKSVVVLAVENDGMQMQQDFAARASEALGMEVLDQIDFQPEQTSYRSVVTKAQALNPDALLIFCAGEDGGTMVKNAAELGMSSIIIGATDWQFPEFPATATLDAMKQHKLVASVGFTYVEGPAWDFYSSEWAKSEYADEFEPSNSYILQYYDLMNVSMLAIEKAGSVDIADWVDAMRDVSMEPGKKVYTYAEGIEALRNGEDIDYDGVTGEFNYTDTGVVGGVFGAFEWTDLETMSLLTLIQGQEVLDLSAKMQ